MQYSQWRRRCIFLLGILWGIVACADAVSVAVGGPQAPADKSVNEVVDASAWQADGSRQTIVPVLLEVTARGPTDVAVQKEAVEQSADRQLLQYVTRHRGFEILGTDYNAVQSTGALAQSLESIVIRYFPYIEQFPQPIWVRIQIDAEAVDPYFQMQISQNGNVGIRLYWNSQIRPEAVARALGWALLQRVAIWRWGQSGPESVPHWLPYALGMDTLVQLQGARIQGLTEDMRTRPDLLPLSALIDSRQGDVRWQEGSDGALQAFWFYRFLRDEMRDRRTYGFLLEAFLDGENPMGLLQRAFPGETANTQLAQEWWEVGLAAILHRQRGVVYSLAESDQLLRSLSGLTVWWEGADHRLSGLALWPLREDQRWQSALWRRQREIKLELSRINPIYFNALLSLGQFYDLLLLRGGDESVSAGREDAERAYAQFLADWAYAQGLRTAVDAALAEEAAPPPAAVSD